MSHNGGYGTTICLSHKSCKSKTNFPLKKPTVRFYIESEQTFKAIKYLVSPNRSSHRRQNANVPKCLFIVFNNCLLRAKLKEKWNYSIPACAQVRKSLPQRDVFGVIVFHIMGTFHIVVNESFACATESFDCIKFIFL